MIRDPEGLDQGEQNAIEPGKRILSAMTPHDRPEPDGSVRMVTGTPGGSKIITTVFPTISNVLDLGMGVVGAVNAPRTVLTGWADPRRGGPAAGC